MNEKSMWSQIQKKIIEVNEFRLASHDEIVDFMMAISEEIIEDFKTVREWHKYSDSRFRYWSYAPTLERGACSVIIRWRKYSGKGKYSIPVQTSELRDDFTLPMKLFPSCTKEEKAVIRDVEERFSIIRKIGKKLESISKDYNALLDMTAARSHMPERADGNADDQRPIKTEEDVLRLTKGPSSPFTEEDRRRFRRNLGLDW